MKSYLREDDDVLATLQARCGWRREGIGACHVQKEPPHTQWPFLAREGLQA